MMFWANDFVEADVIKNGKISVVIPSYNRAKVLPRAINSVLAQRRMADEIIVVDDGSADNTAEVMKAYESCESRVRYVRKENGGPSSARNLGIELASSEYVAFLDSDDEWRDDFLLKTIMLLEVNESAAVVFVDGSLMDESADGEKIIEQSVNWGGRRDGVGELLNLKRGESICIKREVFRKANFYICLPIMSGVVVRADAFAKVGEFDGEYQVSEDYQLWMRMSRFYDFCYVDEPLIVSHIDGTNLSVDSKLQRVFRENNRLALSGELAWETDDKMRRVLKNRLRDNWEAEIFARLNEGKRVELVSAIKQARKDGWRSSAKSMKRIQIVDHFGARVGLFFNRILEILAR